MKQQSRWLGVPLCVLLVLLGMLIPSSPTHAQSLSQFTIAPAFEGNYVPGAWLPLQITLQNDGPDFTALVTAQLPNSLTRHALEVELPQGAQKVVTLYIAMEQETRSILVTSENLTSGALVQQSVEVRPRSGERLMGVMTDQSLVLTLPRRQDLQRLPFVSVDLPPDTFPDRAEGLSSLMLLMLANVSLEGFTEDQQQALLGWVARGGHLVIGGGADLQRTLAGLPPPLQIAEVANTRDLDAEQLGAFVDTSGPAQLQGVTLQPRAGATIFGPVDAPLWVQRDYRDGRITQLAFNVGQEALQEWPAAPDLWNQLLQPTFLVGSASSPETTVDRFQEQALTSAVGQLPSLNLPRSDLLFGLLMLYTFLIGPGIAIVLRRMDRQMWGWVILPATALVMLVIGFGLALQLRADQRIISQVGLVEQVGPEQARVRLLTGILSPQAARFDVAMEPDPLARPMRSLSGPFGPISGSIGDYLQQTDVFSVSVDRWELQGILAEQHVTFPRLDTQIVLNDSTIQAQVRNTTDQSLRDVVVAFGGQVARIGDLEPGQERVADWPMIADPIADDQPPPGTPLSSLVLVEELTASRRPGSVPERQLVLREGLINAAVTRGPAPANEAPIALAWLAQAPLTVTVAAPEAASQQTSLLVTRPSIQGSGAVTLPPYWLKPDLEANNNATCSGSGGAGIAAQSPLTVTLRLPPDLSLLRPTALTLTMESERTWPNAGVTTELFDWEAQQWVDVNYDGPGNLRLPEPQPFLRDGVLQMRLSGTINQANCLFISAQPAGVLP